MTTATKRALKKDRRPSKMDLEGAIDSDYWQGDLPPDKPCPTNALERQDQCHLIDFLKTGVTSTVCYGKRDLYCVDDNSVLLDKKVIYGEDSRFPDEPGDYEENIVAVIIPYEQKEYRHFVIVNADDPGENGFDSTGESTRLTLIGFGFPTVSFRCLGRLLTEKGSINETTVAKRLASGAVELLDFNPDEVRKLTPAQKAISVANAKRKPENRVPIKPPQAGFTLEGHSWHRTATVLLLVGKKRFLLGRDENQYFGCELPASSKAKTVGEAMADLMPPEVRGRGDYVRQGEWFLVPVKPEKVPEKKDCVLLLDGESQGTFLPIETNDSAQHVISTGDGRVSKAGIVYLLDPTIEHSGEQHADLDVKGWHTPYRNTAVRSVSVEGVD